MSGGSYEYLCFADDVAALAAKRDELERMLDRLGGLPWAQVAATETARLLAALNVLESRIRAADELRSVWRAIEWWDSGDWGEDAAREAVRAFEDLSSIGAARVS